MRTEVVTFASGHHIHVLEHRAQRHNFARWEARYIRALADVLRPGDTVFDIGAEEGEFSALVGSIVGGENVHLFEPSPTSWPSIRAVWEANHLEGPGGCFQGFAAAHTTHDGPVVAGWWPAAASGPISIETCFAVVTERPDIPAIRLGDYADRRGVTPDVLMIDVEGAEGLVLSGLGPLHPRAVFVSIHPHDFIARFGMDQEQVFRALAALGYEGTFLGFDHEAHWCFR